MIQHGGWTLIALALGTAVSGYNAGRSNPERWWLPLMLCIIAGTLLFITANDKSIRTLYPVGIDGQPDTTQPGVVASLGIGIYLAGVAVATALIGSIMLRPADTSISDSDETGSAAEASGERAVAPQKTPTSTDTAKPVSKVKCHACQHVQTVPIAQATFICEQCGTRLRRKA